jgi:oligopeptide/dipeptide ABC transporter ATP-binding protein
MMGGVDIRTFYALGTAKRAKACACNAGPPASALRPPAGCRFHPRCPQAMGVCAQRDPVPVAMPTGQFAACHLLDTGKG